MNYFKYLTIRFKLRLFEPKEFISSRGLGRFGAQFLLRP